ncbi:DNA polymerase III subunit beta [Candidatus Microgenomates bacterium]|nr:DNA polymerase III subunit beta [Candidatus Microgenomates bacterium]
MQISLLQEELIKGINTVYRFVSTKSQLPILSHILISIEKGRIRLCGTNLESGINYWLGAKVEEDGQIAVPAKILVDTISSLKPGKIELTEKEGILTISSGNSLITIPTIPANDFPQVDYELSKQKIVLPKNLLESIVHQVLFTAGGEEGRVEFTGVLFWPRDKELVVVATDGVRLSVKRLTTSLDLPGKMLIPAKIIGEINKIFNNSEVKFSFDEDKNQALFGNEDIVVVSKVLDSEKYPDFERIIPQGVNVTILADKEELQNTLKLSAIFSRDYGVRLEFANNECVLVSENPQTGTQKSTIPVKLEGDSLIISFNWRFLNDFLNSVSGSEVEFKFVNNMSPGLFIDPKDKTYTHLIMPIRTNEAESS